MIPIQDIYAYYCQVQHPSLFSYFPFQTYPYPQQENINFYQKPELSKQFQIKEFKSVSSQVSAEDDSTCKVYQFSQIKQISLSVVPSPPLQIETINTSHPMKNKNENQKEGRNANSNILRMFFRRFHQRIEAEPQIISKCIKKNHLKLKPAKFLQWLELNDVEHRNYVRLPEMKELFAGSRGSREQAKLMRILLKDFLQREALVCCLTSKKIKRLSMSYNFKSIRNVLKDILNIRT